MVWPSVEKADHSENVQMFRISLRMQAFDASRERAHSLESVAARQRSARGTSIQHRGRQKFEVPDLESAVDRDEHQLEREVRLEVFVIRQLLR